MNRQLIGWIVAAVLAVALGGVIIYQATDNGGSSRRAALGSGAERSLPSAVSGDFNQIQEDKDTPGTRELPETREGQEGPHMNTNGANTCNPNLSPNAFPEWRNDPANLNEAESMADEIVVGTVMGTRPGTPFVVKAPDEPGGTITTPVQNVMLHVDQEIKGNASENLTIQRLGDGAGCFRPAGDPSYQQGQRYLLLLENGAGNRPPHTISPAGRYMVAANNTLQAEAENPFAGDVAGDTLREVIAGLRR